MNTQNDAEILNFWRFLNLAECKSLPVGRRVEVYDVRRNRIAHVKITSVHTWVTRPNNCEIGWKYGLYDYGKVKIDQYHSNDFFVARKEVMPEVK